MWISFKGVLGIPPPPILYTMFSPKCLISPSTFPVRHCLLEFKNWLLFQVGTGKLNFRYFLWIFSPLNLFLSQLGEKIRCWGKKRKGGRKKVNMVSKMEYTACKTHFLCFCPPRPCSLGNDNNLKSGGWGGGVSKFTMYTPGLRGPWSP